LPRIPEEVIRRVNESVDIVDVVSRYVTLKRSGRSFKGLCPFHEEKTPSFHVFPESARGPGGRFKCFGCGEGGDVIAFLMKRDGLPFHEAVEELAQQAGIPLPAADDPREAARQRRRQAQLQALEFAARFFQAVLDRPTGGHARRYLEEREFERATVEAFGLGFSPDAFDGLLGTARARGIDDEVLFEAGLVKRSERGRVYDAFRGRVMFPIRDLGNRVIGFGARAMGDAQPKYLNSPDGPLFHKGRELYGLAQARDAAREAGRLIVVEGYTDVMHCHQAGIRETAAGLGTALTADAARLLRRLGVPVLLLYDGDTAGRRAAERAADAFLAEGVEGAVALLPAGRDPADLLLEEGVDALEEVLDGAQDLWSYRVDAVLARHDDQTLEARLRAVAELTPALERLRDPIRRDLAFKLLSERTGVPESTLRNQTREPVAAPRTSEAGRRAPSAAVARDRMEVDFLRESLRDPVLFGRVLAVYPVERFQNPSLRALAGTMHGLLGRGESLTFDAVYAAVAGEPADRDQDGPGLRLQALQWVDVSAEDEQPAASGPPEDEVSGESAVDEGRARVEAHLHRLAEQKKVEAAAGNLRAIVQARGGQIAEEPTSEHR